MGKLHIEELVVGMVLEADAVGIHGRRLFPAGVELGKEQIQIMKAWGVTEAEVRGETHNSKANAFAVSSDAVERARNFLDEFFQKRQNGLPFLEELYRLSLQRTAVVIEQGNFVPLSVDDLERLREGASSIEPAAGRISAETLAQDQAALLSFPSVYAQIKKELKSPVSSARRLGEVVSMDTVLAAKILRLVNSPFYGFPSAIDSMDRAIAILGANELTTLALGISAVNCFRGIPSDIFNMRHFWRHTVSCGVLARLLAGQKRGLSDERFFVAGILHDIGLLVFVRHMPRALCRALYLARKNKMPLHQAEVIVFGFTHAQVGALLLRQWGIPDSLLQLVEHVNTPQQAATPLEPALLLIAKILATALRTEDCGGMYLPEISSEVLDTVGLSPSILEPVFKQFDRQFHDVVNIFLSEEHDE